MRSVLVVDDNRSAADALAAVLRREGHDAEAAYSGEAAVERLDRGGIDVVLTDLKMDGLDGLGVLGHARGLERPPEVFVLTGYGSVGDAVEAMRLGARDFLTKPVSPAAILEALAGLVSRELPVEAGASAAAVALREALAAVGGVTSTVLLVGEPGSGRRRVALGLAGAGVQVLTRPSAGLAGDPEVVVVPDVDRLPDDEQLALTRLLDGLVDGPRILATAGPGWRGSELYFRLAVLVVRVPSLRERLDDLPALVDAMVADRERALGRTAARPGPDELAALRRHAWPGNLRELEAVVERAVVFGSWALDVQPVADAVELGGGFSLSAHLEAVERGILEQALQRAGGDRNAAGRLLGLERNTLRYKLKKYGLL